MTRSVEIPEAAVEAAADAAGVLMADARAAIEAALPYLAPAGDDKAYHYSTEEIAAKVADRVPHADLDGFTLSERLRIGKAVAPLFQEMLPPVAPAVPQPADREALAKAIHDSACGCDHYGHMVEIDDHEAADIALAVLAGEQEQVEQ